MFDDSMRDLLGFNANTIYKEYKLPPDLVDMLSFHKIFLKCDIAQGMSFKGKRSGMIHFSTMDVYSGYKNIEKF